MKSRNSFRRGRSYETFMHMIVHRRHVVTPVVYNHAAIQATLNGNNHPQRRSFLVNMPDIWAPSGAGPGCPSVARGLGQMACGLRSMNDHRGPPVNQARTIVVTGH
jgi:hypothetical protein